jgi:uncharacterized membrane protein
MARTVEVNHQVWIDASPDTVKSQFADLNHHIDTNVHPSLRFEVLAQEPRRARFTQEVKLLGMRQRDLFDRIIDEDGTIHDESIEGFNKGGKLDFRFFPAAEGGREGTRVDITIRLQTPPLLGWLAPMLRSQVLREVTEAALQDKRDIERGYQPRAVGS